MADSNSNKKIHVLNQPYDESVSVGDDEEIESELSPTPRVQTASKFRKPEQMTTSIEASEDEFDDENSAFVEPKDKLKQSRPPKAGSGQRPVGGHVIEASDEDDDEEDGSESSEDEDEKEGIHVKGAYDPTEFEHLPVSKEIKELFQYIVRYVPQTIDLDYKLRPFIPEYIPAVGDIDAFLKVTRPDGKPETLGIRILDEPAAEQSDPTVLDLQLRSISKQTSAKQTIVRSIEDPDKNPKAIDSWITNIVKLHREKPPQNVHYTKPMPDIEKLMQEWPPEFEELLNNLKLPSADIECELAEYIDIICAIVDIPVYASRIQSLHLLFTLYSEFKNSQHFNQLAKRNVISNDLKNTGNKQSPSISYE
ncbi:intraflagellar transport protein 46 homolog isoform X1 [Hydra vulgaris]|nr:intraflagellar transport protein 46 homolog [Hydra vulgaris]